MTHRIASVPPWWLRVGASRYTGDRWNVARPNSEQGLTILECLVAIMLIGLTAALLTPPLLVATAGRIQNRRAEQAFQVAQSEVDRVNTLVQLGRHRNEVLPQVVAVQSGGNLANVPPPTQISQLLASPRSEAAPCPGVTAYKNQPLPVGTVLPVDVDGDCKPELLMQVFRTQGVTTQLERNKPDIADRRPAQFDLGVRVYSILARENLLAGKLETENASLRISNKPGQQSTHPLLSVYKPISWGERSSTLCTYLGATGANAISECENLQP